MSRPPFASLRPPPAPAGLRGRVLAACSEALAAQQPEGLLDRLWRSRLARRAWLAAVAVLLVGHLAVLPRQAAGGRTKGSSVTARAALWQEIGLPQRWQPRARPTTWADLSPARGRLGLEFD